MLEKKTWMYGRGVEASFELKLHWSIELPAKPKLPTSSLTIRHAKNFANLFSTGIRPLLTT